MEKSAHWNGQIWRDGDRVRSQAFGDGSIMMFQQDPIRHGAMLRVMVRFDRPTVGVSWVNIFEIERILNSK